MSDLTLGSMESEVSSLPRDRFVEKYPEPFLLWEESGSIDQGPPTPTSQWRVFAAAKTERNTFKDMVTIGRTDDNDIVLKEGSVSKFHAYLSYSAQDTSYLITDAGSHNGTSLNQRNLLAHQSVGLESGQQITLGRISLHFYSPSDFYDAVTALKARGEL